MTKLNYTLRSFKEDEVEALKALMYGVEWGKHYVDVHADIANDLLKDKSGEVVVAERDGQIIGFVSLKHVKLNFLTYVPTLVVSKQFNRQGLGKALLQTAEDRAREKNNRGIYLDTPEDNQSAREFYNAIGYQEAYTMPHFYLDNLNGVTYLKLFNPSLKA